MKLASPDHVIKHFYPEFTVKKLLGLEFNRLSASAESSGYRSNSFVGNMSTYIMFAFIAGGLVIFNVILIFACRKRISKSIGDRLDGFKKKYTSFNPHIQSSHIIFLEACISYALYFHTLSFDNWR